MVEKFELTNARGISVGINNFKLMSYTPTGLGLKFNNNYNNYQTYFKMTKQSLSQGQFNAKILFGSVVSETFDSFQKFSEFLAYQPYTMTYTSDSGTWNREAMLSEMTKSEIGSSSYDPNLLDESFTLEFINNWYNNKSAEYKSYDPDPNLGTYGKIYKYTYQPYYVYMESSVNLGEKMMPLVNDSKYFGVQQGSPCIVTITGATTNPHWTVLQDGVTVSTDGFTLTLADNQRLIVSSYPEDQYARVYNPDGSFADVSQLQDFTMTNFVQIPEGESTVLVYVDKDTGVNLTFKEERLLV